MLAAATLMTEMAEADEGQLIAQAQAFDEGAWAQIYDQHFTRLFRYSYLRTGDWAVAEDLAAEVFLEALRGIQGYRFRGIPFSAWLYRIARNLTADHLSRKSRRPTVSLMQEAAHPGLQVEDRHESLASEEIQSVLSRLTNDQQQVIILRFYQGLSHEETAQAMGRRSGAVRVLQNRAINSLRRIMAEERG